MVKFIIKQGISSIILPFYRLKEAMAGSSGTRVLIYHSIDNPVANDTMGLRIKINDFQRQMRDLKEWGYRVIRIESIFEKEGANHPKEKTVVLTFDDGYKDFLVNALPVLNSFNYPAAIFVTAEYLDHSGINKKADYWDYWEKLDWSDLQRIAALDNITIGCHGLSHAKLDSLDDEGLSREILYSKGALENKLNKRINYFAYPHGLYNKTCFEMLKEGGYRAAFTGRPGRVYHTADDYELNRTEISRYDNSSLEFKKKLIGAYDWLALKHFIFR